MRSAKPANHLNYIIKRFYEENPIMSELFSRNNLLLCGMQGNNALLGKTLKKIQNQYTVTRFSLLISATFVVRAAVECLNKH